MRTDGSIRSKRGSLAILALFLLLAGGGAFVYGVAHGRPAVEASR